MSCRSTNVTTNWDIAFLGGGNGRLSRLSIVQLSLLFSNVWRILGGLAPNFGSLIVARGLCGLSQAVGSVTLGVVADMWDATEHGYAVAFVVLASVGGSVVGPVFGDLMQEHRSWHWNFWIQLIFNGIAQILHLMLIPETRSSILVNREAKHCRRTGEDPILLWSQRETSY